MIGLQKLDRHADLVGRMAETLNADLGDALVAGRLRGPELRTAVLRCAGCTKGAACADWLNRNASGAGHAPGYCRNGALFDRLRP